MKLRLSRRAFMLQMLFSLAACTTEETIINPQSGLVIGVISYGQGQQTVERLSSFRKYLSEQLKTIVQIEPAFNERIAIEQIKRHYWSLVFATPGLAAIAIANYQYSTLFPLQIGTSSRSIIVVNQNSPLKKLSDLQGKNIALGQEGDATGYYLPLYNLYGLTLASILFAPTSKESLEWVSQGKVDAAAMSLEEFNFYKSKLNSVFRVLFNDSHTVPSGAVLVSPKLEQNRVNIIANYIKKAPPTVIQQAKYLPSESPPDYQYMIEVVKRVTSITQNLNSKPVRLFN
ncbi:phosphate/phosphite/phosphonate ABC transporter substrate-binding protein [Rivularia sp. UHCC 0363]|uniref:phosphate/phosphite/phosphonate ABC transporter substrate-binding protein n=1 Tax=Rivularia sp. UHCC 0363 TaxID=3110244 RepID=UPI002B1FF0D1|nr:PhnD/SsuA/transferrin family substrate-binding protein [Rivularia sp. UHCC 0363]MEA5595615.1 PhnD/SsuA/transferrin family substrate-binding protein [Rivularia sp. UHCC 0363]